MRRDAPGRVGEGAEEVEGRRRAQLAAHRRGEAHRRMEALGEAEADADLAHAAAHALGTEVDDDAERLEHVDRPALRRCRPTAVLGDPRAGGGGHDRGHGRDVDGAGAVAAGAARVDERHRRRRSGRRARRSRAWSARARPARPRSRPWPGVRLRMRRSARRSRRPTGSPTSPVRSRSSGRSSRRSRRPITSGHSAAFIRRMLPAAVRDKPAPGRPTQALLRRWRTSRRRSRSSRPPHTPCFSRAMMACSRHGSRTGQTAQICLGRLATVLGLGRRVEELRVGSQTSCVLAPVVRHRFVLSCLRAGERPVRPHPTP